MLGKRKKQKIETAISDERFLNIKFAGTFREYQQRVIDNSAGHMKDGKVHIVAAPGSGKTILGLELIRRLGKPALILSPTIAIREQWKERFAEMFTPVDGNVDTFVSCTLHKPKLLTSITYQGLYTSYRRTNPTSMFDQKVFKPEDTDENDDTPHENYSSVSVIDLIKEHKISTLCLDEAHHLRAEWQKALYEFVSQVEHEVTIIALTATPPYDSKKHEWDKYITMCGPIDEEIFVPELIRTKTLCPHQDFIYYSFPTKDETDVIEKYQKNVDETLKQVFTEGRFLEIIKNCGFYKDPDEFEDELSDRPEFVKALLAFLDESGEKPPKQLRKSLERDDRSLTWDLSVAQTLFQCIISDDQLFEVKDRDYVKAFLSRHGLIEKGQVGLITSGDIEKLLFTSIGKLASIGTIVDEEYKNLGDKTRLLILTDYIRVNSKVLGSDQEIKEMGVVPIFELIRRKNLDLKLAAVSGKIIIVPNTAVDEIKKLAGDRLKVIPIKDTNHSELKFDGDSSAQKIAAITKAFNAGIINGIVGTKSLLGEGWDSPVINTLILASFVGSFMLSNQMRGRAIRVDKFVPDKVSNIWHLTAILPEHLRLEVSANIPPSADYATLERRFQGFLGVNYYSDIIESSLSRANTLHAPYDEANVKRANEKTFELAKDREAIRKAWEQALAKSSNEVIIQNEIPQPKRGFIPAIILRPSHYSTVKKVTHAVIKTFKELGLINKKAKAIIEKDYKDKKVNVGIFRCSQYEKNIFHQAMSEVLGPIDNPRYVLAKIKRNMKPDFRCAFAAPEAFSKNKDNAEVFKQKMTRRIADFESYFTRSDEGKKILASAKKKAYVNKTNNEIAAKMKLRAN